jgi:hypothetical protein
MKAVSVAFVWLLICALVRAAQKESLVLPVLSAIAFFMDVRSDATIW